MTLEERFEAARLAEEAKHKQPGEPSPVEKRFDEAAAAGAPPPPMGGNEVMGDQLSNTISLGMLDKIRGPMASFVNSVNRIGAPSVPQLPEQSSEEVSAQLKQGEKDRPGAAMAGKAAGRGIQALALAPLMPFTTLGGAALTGGATAGLPSAAQNAVEYGRGKKSGSEALTETAIDTGIGAAGGVAGRALAGLVPGSRAATLIGQQKPRPIPETAGPPRPTTGIKDSFAGVKDPNPFAKDPFDFSPPPPVNRTVAPVDPLDFSQYYGPKPGVSPPPGMEIPKGPLAAVAGRDTPSAGGKAFDTFVKTVMPGAGVGGYGGGTGGAIAGALAPAGTAGAAQAIKNAGTNAASEALSLLERNPTLALQLAGNRTTFEEVMRALMAAGSGPNLAPATPQP
jgi:hypothetical protein